MLRVMRVRKEHSLHSMHSWWKTQDFSHPRPQRPRSFWSAPRIATSGPVQRHSVFEWLCKHNRLRSQAIRFVRLESEHAQSDGKSVNRGLPVLDLAGQRSRFLVLTKRSAASGDENGFQSGPNYTTAAHAFVKATLRLGLRAPFVARNYTRYFRSA